MAYLQKQLRANQTRQNGNRIQMIRKAVSTAMDYRSAVCGHNICEYKNWINIEDCIVGALAENKGNQVKYYE